MATFHLGPIETHDIETIKRALEAHRDSIDDCLENGPVLTVEESLAIRTERRRVIRLIDVCEALAISE